ncbi:MAG: hypothetical protein COX65_01300 [Elusimicrobia bacterium CG_4_10_14_0_2_um_filter_56_8]|nr:MAG: hypothetical protein AUJ51_12285 [Elusimicrobia bacterium CG1_02_56_21]PJA17091.1 MAG: hypothetical protein COX65_01300 [Elusimicrobia bacterium CG_4_10_14_0_2_um_filter_56_8]
MYAGAVKRFLISGKLPDFWYYRLDERRKRFPENFQADKDSGGGKTGDKGPYVYCLAMVTMTLVQGIINAFFMFLAHGGVYCEPAVQGGVPAHGEYGHGAGAGDLAQGAQAYGGIGRP